MYEGTFSTPKTAVSRRCIPLSPAALQLVHDWRSAAKRRKPDDLVFGTKAGKPVSPNNVLRRWIVPACAVQGLPNATWLTFRRTFSSWSHEKGVPSKVTAELMGHSKVDVTLNPYTQVLPDALHAAVSSVSEELFKIVQSPAGTRALVH